MDCKSLRRVINVLLKCGVRPDGQREGVGSPVTLADEVAAVPLAEQLVSLLATDRPVEPETHNHISLQPETHNHISLQPETHNHISLQPETHNHISLQPETHNHISLQPETHNHISLQPAATDVSIST